MCTVAQRVLCLSPVGALLKGSLPSMLSGFYNSRTGVYAGVGCENGGRGWYGAVEGPRQHASPMAEAASASAKSPAAPAAPACRRRRPSGSFPSRDGARAASGDEKYPARANPAPALSRARGVGAPPAAARQARGPTHARPNRDAQPPHRAVAARVSAHAVLCVCARARACRCRCAVATVRRGAAAPSYAR